MSLPHLAAQGILVYPLCGLSQLRGPEVGADPRTCCAVRGEGLSKVVILAIIPTQINEEPKIISFNLLYLLINKNLKINW